MIFVKNQSLSFPFSILWFVIWKKRRCFLKTILRKETIVYKKNYVIIVFRSVLSLLHRQWFNCPIFRFQLNLFRHLTHSLYLFTWKSYIIRLNYLVRATEIIENSDNLYFPAKCHLNPCPSGTTYYAPGFRFAILKVLTLGPLVWKPARVSPYTTLILPKFPIKRLTLSL